MYVVKEKNTEFCSTVSEMNTNATNSVLIEILRNITSVWDKIVTTHFLLFKPVFFPYSSATWDSASAGVSSFRMKDDYATPEGLDDRFRPTIDRDGA